MTIANQIRSKLLELEGGVFQRLCDDWLHRKGYENINSIGMMDTTDRVTKGTPDCLFIQPDGYYVFSEYTVQQNRLAAKLEDDISKCFDEQKTGIKSEQISEIIICYLGNLTTHEINHLKSSCQKRNVRLSLNGLDSISLSIQNCYPVLSERHLGLALDTGQLLSVNDFINRYGKNNLTTPIDNKILFQSDAIDKSLEQLRLWRLLLVSGAAGVGKTLFSVNLVRTMQKNNPALKVYCLFDKGADLIRDITAHFSEPGDYLIFVDDANRLDSRLDYILHYLNENDENRTFRIVATVRDYARDSVLTQASKFTEVQEQTIQPLTDEQIKELVVELFDIKNGEYQQRIQEISGGNARLAMMAAKVAVETNQIQSIQNVASLYDDYFSQNENIREVVEDDKLMTAACAISFFRKIDKLNESHMEWLQNSFGISPEEFWGYVELLHKKELVDLYEDEVVKISDQVLSTYFFYLSVFEKKVISFSLIVHHFYPDFKRTIVDALNPVINSFDHKKIVTEIRSEVEGIFKEISNSGDLKSSIEFLNSFWFALPTETLIFANKLISEMPIVDESWEDEAFEEAKTDENDYSLVSLLSSFRNYGDDEFKMSFDLLLQYLSKSKESLGFIIKTLTDRYNFKPDDMRYGYYVQDYVVDTLVERIENGDNYLFSRVFIVLAKSFLKVEHSEHRWGRGNTITMVTYRLSPDEYLTPIRQKIFKNLTTLMLLPDYEQLIQDTFQELISRLRVEGKEMAEADLPFITEFFISNLDPKNTLHCLIMQDLCEHLDALEIKFPSKWHVDFNNSTIELSNLLLEDRHEMRMLDMGYEEYNQYRHQCFVDYFSDTTVEKFSEFMSQCVSLQNSLSGRERDYSLKVGIEMSLKAIAENHHDQIKEIVSIYFDYDDIFNIHPGSLIFNLFRTLRSSEVWELIDRKSYRWKKNWRSFYFSMLPEDDINEDETHSLLTHLNETPSNELPAWLDFLSKYQVIDKEIYVKVVRLLVEKSEEDKNYAASLRQLFNKDYELFGNWFEVFKSDTQLVFSAYLAALKNERYYDNKGEALALLTEEEPSFMNKIVDCIYENERYPDEHTSMPELIFLWERDNYLDAVEQYGKYVYIKEQNSYGFGGNIFTKLFSKEKGRSEPDELMVKKQDFIKHTVRNNIDDIGYICFIFKAANCMGQSFRRKLLGIFLQHNKKIDDFKKLEYEPKSRSWSGSQVPTLEKEKNYLITLLSLLNSVDLLEHRSNIEKRIEYKLKYIESEKKRDFLESRQ